MGQNGESASVDVCYECFQGCVSPEDEREYSFALDLGNARSAPGVDVVPTFTTNNDRICLLLSTQKMGMLRIEDAERLQVFCIHEGRREQKDVFRDSRRASRGPAIQFSLPD